MIENATPERLERFLPDIMHAGLLGTAKVHNGAVLTYLVEHGAWGAWPRGVYEDIMTEKLRTAYAAFKAWCKQHRLRVVQPRFTPARLHRKQRSSFPALSAKAVAGKVVSFWLASVAAQWASRAEATATDKLVWVCAYAYCSMVRKLGSLPFVLSEAEAQSVYNDGILHLQAYAQLRSLSAATARGNMKASFLILPKHHHIQEMLRTMLAERVNPNWYALLTAEAFVGHIGRLTRMLGDNWHIPTFRNIVDFPLPSLKNPGLMEGLRTEAVCLSVDCRDTWPSFTCESQTSSGHFRGCLKCSRGSKPKLAVCSSKKPVQIARASIGGFCFFRFFRGLKSLRIPYACVREIFEEPLSVTGVFNLFQDSIGMCHARPLIGSDSHVCEQ